MTLHINDKSAITDTDSLKPCLAKTVSSNGFRFLRVSDLKRAQGCMIPASLSFSLNWTVILHYVRVSTQLVESVRQKPVFLLSLFKTWRDVSLWLS